MSGEARAEHVYCSFYLTPSYLPYGNIKIYCHAKTLHDQSLETDITVITPHPSPVGGGGRAEAGGGMLIANLGS